jgi:nucleoside-triphosphatase THEP1
LGSKKDPNTWNGVTHIQRQILITGGISQGKTTFLLSLAGQLGPEINMDGVVSIASERAYQSGTPAGQYRLRFLKSRESMIWACRRESGQGFIFDPGTQAFLNNDFMARLVADPPQVLFLDELGKLELKESGLDQILATACIMNIQALICTVKKECVDEIRKAYGFKSPLLVDLDRVSRSDALNQVKAYLGCK